MSDIFTTQCHDILENTENILLTHNAVLEAIHNGGIAYTSDGKSGITKQFQIMRVHPDDSETINLILEAANAEPALVGLTPEKVISLCTKGLALCALEKLPNGSKQFASYLGAEDLTAEEVWKRKGEQPYCEIRSSVTLVSHRGYGLNQLLKQIQVPNIIKQYGLAPTPFTDDIPAFEDLEAIKSASIGINTKLGFIQVKVANLPSALKALLVESCPPGRCANHGDHHPTCSCSIWVPPVAKILSWNTSSLLEH